MKKFISITLSFFIILTPIISLASNIPVWSKDAVVETISKIDNKVQF